MREKGSAAIIFLIVVVVAVAITAFFLMPDIRREIQRRNFKVQKFTGNVVATKSVTIAQCKIEPVISFAKLNSELAFVNTDNTNHVLFFKEGHYTVPARGTLKLDLNFLKTPGNKGFDCDSHKHAGVISIFFEGTTTPTVHQTASTTRN